MENTRFRFYQKPKTACAWLMFLSYLVHVLRDGCLSEIVLILFGVPQGSVIGPILFILYVVEVFGIIASYGLDCHSYADDTQVYISVPATVADDAATRAVSYTHLTLPTIYSV